MRNRPARTTCARPAPSEGVEALCFDVFGTLLDWRSSLIARLSDFGKSRGIEADWADFADRWRAFYQPSLERVRSEERGWLPLDQLHRESLDAVLEELELEPCEADRDALNRSWHRLEPWPEVGPALEALGERFSLVSLSNADLGMSRALAEHAELRWHHILGAEPAQSYKPQPRVYTHAASRLGLRPSACMMVAAHNRDLEAAAAVGFRTAFVCRPFEHGLEQDEDLSPEGPWDFSVGGLNELAWVLGCDIEQRGARIHG